MLHCPNVARWLEPPAIGLWPLRRTMEFRGAAPDWLPLLDQRLLIILYVQGSCFCFRRFFGDRAWHTTQLSPESFAQDTSGLVLVGGATRPARRNAMVNPAAQV